MTSRSHKGKNQRLKHKHYEYVLVDAATSQNPKTYLIRSIAGRLSGMDEDGRVFISKRHHRDHRPRFFYCSDLSLSAEHLSQTLGL